MGLKTVEVIAQDLPITPTLLWGGVPLFNVSDGLKLLDYCESNGVAVLGVEGFAIKGGKRVPDMDCIVDFSASLTDLDFLRRSIEASRKIIEGKMSSGIVLEFLLIKAFT